VGNHRGVQIYIEQSTAWATAFSGVPRRFLSREAEPCSGISSGMPAYRGTYRYMSSNANEEIRRIFESASREKMKPGSGMRNERRIT
jgi:hypothetical protein